ncbi:MAG: family 78 glycoside hydrolase catalytic domain, partial [Tepidisphaeraceae bacterium]
MNWLAMVSGSMLLCAMAGCATGALSATDGGQTGMRASALRCEYLDNPLGLGETAPRLSWVVESSRRGAKQSAYEVRVASTADRLAKGQADVWDSGKVKSADTAQIVYGGPPLTSRETCFWQVRSWDADNVPGPWSTAAQWEMGLLNSDDWHAQWIEAAPIAGVAKGGPIHLLHASYETLDKKTAKDVTALVAAAVRGNTLAFKVQNDTLGGDPAYRKVKQLRIDYEQDGRRKSAVAGEFETLSIPQQALPYLRKGFEAKGEIRRARLYVTALGLYEISINGNRVGDHVLAPDWTDYDKRVQYQAYDVTKLLQRGRNAMGALVADGWYAGHIGNRGYRHWGQVPALCAQLEITYADGSVERVVTDGTWKAHSSPIVSSDFMLGEIYDAGLAVAGWDQPGLDERDWSAVSTRDESARRLVAQSMQPVRVTGEIAAKTVTEPTPGHFVYDLGQNMVGVVRLKVRAPAGTKITVRHAEMLNPDGTLYTTNLRGAPSIDTYVLGDNGEHVCQPHFTFHGFRYVEVTGTDRLAPADVCGIVLGSDTPRTGEFACSDPRINQLQSNIQWGQRGNYLSVPTDCPQRDERLGWMGDAQVFVRTATFNSDVAAFFTKWLVDVDDAQTPDGRFADVSPDTMHNAGAPAWADAGVICPWTIYQVYGDPRVLERHLPAMTRWVDYCRAHSDGLLRDKDRGSDFGDWLSIGANTPKDVIGTAYFAYSTHLLAKSYAAVGRSAEARKYQQLFDDICRAFTKAYVSADGRIKGDTQCVYAMALKFELLPEAMRPLAASHLVDDITAKHDHL